MSIFDITKYSENFINVIDSRLKQQEQSHLKKLQKIINNYNQCYQHITNNQNMIKQNQNQILNILQQLMSQTNEIQSHLSSIQNRMDILEKQIKSA